MIVACVDDYLSFWKKDKALEELIITLKDEFKLTDQDDLDTFLVVLIKKIWHNNL